MSRTVDPATLDRRSVCAWITYISMLSFSPFQLPSDNPPAGWIDTPLQTNIFRSSSFQAINFPGFLFPRRFFVIAKYTLAEELNSSCLVSSVTWSINLNNISKSSSIFNSSDSMRLQWRPQWFLRKFHLTTNMGKISPNFLNKTDVRKFYETINFVIFETSFHAV